MTTQRQYIAIDLKSFYASVECVERGLDPLDTHLVVADSSRTSKTICLAVSPSLKAQGVGGRPRLFEVVQKVKEINQQRIKNAPYGFQGMSIVESELQNHPEIGLDYIIASPRMALYLDYSTRIFKIFLKYIAPDDINVYSIDEVFIDATSYLKNYKLSALELTSKIVQEIFLETGITATAGIGTNLYLAKIAMDIVAKHAKADKNGLRIAAIDEISYRKLLWDHKPITDFWRVGRGYATRLAEQNMFTMGDIALCSLGTDDNYYNKDLLFKMFGVNAELLIDHAWGYETTTISDIKKVRPERKSLGEGQVLQCPYDYQKACIVIREMAEQLALNLTEKKLICKKLVLTVGYDSDNLKNQKLRPHCTGEIVIDGYGRRIPKSAHGTQELEVPSASLNEISKAALKLFDRIINHHLLIRRINLTAIELQKESMFLKPNFSEGVQLDLFASIDESLKRKESLKESLKREQKLQKAILNIKHKYGKNALLKATSLQDGATSIQRNAQIGGHKA